MITTGEHSTLFVVSVGDGGSNFCDNSGKYYFGMNSNTVNSFNFYGGTHLADQNQNICVRFDSKKYLS